MLRRNYRFNFRYWLTGPNNNQCLSGFDAPQIGCQIFLDFRDIDVSHRPIIPYKRTGSKPGKRARSG